MADKKYLVNIDAGSNIIKTSHTPAANNEVVNKQFLDNYTFTDQHKAQIEEIALVMALVGS